tara:strand:- start:43491 stop:43835 length:345 start_codon:yes stop_codon:yes gene_type:complete
MKKVLLGLVILFSMSASAMTIGSDEINTVALDSISVDANAIMTAMSDANVNSAIYSMDYDTGACTGTHGTVTTTVVWWGETARVGTYDSSTGRTDTWTTTRYAAQSLCGDKPQQ